MSDEWDEPAYGEEMSEWLSELSADLDFVDDWHTEPEDARSPHSSEDSSENWSENCSVSKKRRGCAVKKRNPSRTVKKVSSTKALVVSRDSQVGQPSSETHPRWSAFPSFNRSDATIYFASTFARMSNNGDMHGLHKLVTNHCAKDINVCLRPEFTVSLTMFLEMMSVHTTITPDEVCCMHSTKVVDNTITAVLYTKATDVAEMYAYNACVVEEKYKWIFVGTRKDIFEKKFRIASLDKATKKAIYKLLEMDATLQVYGKIDIALVLHPRTKKIVEFSFVSTYTSICHNGVHYSLL